MRTNVGACRIHEGRSGSSLSFSFPVLRFRVSIPPPVMPTLLRLMDMGSLTCAQMWVPAAHTKRGQALISFPVWCFRVSIPPAVMPTLLRLMGSLTCAQHLIWVPDVHTKGGQAQTSLRKS